LNNAEVKNSEKTKEINDEDSKLDKKIDKNDKKENSDEAIVKKNKFSFNQNKLVNNEKRD
ncbi:MAG: ParA family protein, partial [Anaerococcus obesiensis]